MAERRYRARAEAVFRGRRIEAEATGSTLEEAERIARAAVMRRIVELATEERPREDR